VISWGAQGGTGGGANAPPACMLKKALFPIVNQFFSFLQTKIASAHCVKRNFPNICF
jgi:hypothetical protein